MKRVISFFTVLLLITGLFSAVTFGKENYEIRLSAPSQVAPSNVLTVTVSLFGNCYRGAEGALSYDASEMELLSVSPSEKGGTLCKTEKAENEIRFLLYGDKKDKLFYSETKAFTAQFKLSAALKEGEIVTLEGKDVIFTDEAFKSNAAQPVTLSRSLSKAPDKGLLLKSLFVKGGKLVPDFSPEQKAYYCELPTEVETPEITALAADGKAKITLSDLKLFPSVEKDVTVTVEKDGKKEVYTITFLRKADEKAPLYKDATLSSLSVEGCETEPLFESAIFDYTLIVPKGVTEIKVSAITTNPKAFYYVDGDGKITEETSLITVTVIGEDGVTKEQYRLSLKRGEVETEKKTYTVLILSLSAVGVLLIALAVAFIIIRKRRLKLKNTVQKTEKADKKK